MINGNFIQIHSVNIFYDHVEQMLLEHFDNEKYKDCVFLLGTYCREAVSKTKLLYPKKRIITYQLEQLMGGSNWHNIENTIKNLKSAEEIWDYDSLNVSYLKYFNIKVNKIVPMLYTQSLKRVPKNENPFFDVLFYGFMNQRRFNIFNKIQSELYSQIKLNWVYGSTDIDKYIADSKIILNLHAFDPYNRQEQTRMFYPVINGKTVISEQSQYNNMQGCIIETSLDNLSKTLLLASTTSIWKDFGIQAEKNFISLSNERLSNDNIYLQ
jgi:hypothetical protein